MTSTDQWRLVDEDEFSFAYTADELGGAETADLAAVRSRKLPADERPKR